MLITLGFNMIRVFICLLLQAHISKSTFNNFNDYNDDLLDGEDGDLDSTMRQDNRVDKTTNRRTHPDSPSFIKNNDNDDDGDDDDDDDDDGGGHNNNNSDDDDDVNSDLTSDEDDDDHHHDRDHDNQHHHHGNAGPSLQTSILNQLLEEIKNETGNPNETETGFWKTSTNDTSSDNQANGTTPSPDVKASTTSPPALKTAEDPIVNLTTTCSAADHVCLNWLEKDDKSIHCSYLLDGSRTSSYLVKRSENHVVNFTLFGLQSPGKEYDFSISCGSEGGKEFIHSMKIQTKPSAIPSLTVVSKDTNSVSLEWFQPGYLDDVEVFMAGKELSSVLSKHGNDERDQKIHLQIRDLPESGLIYHVTIYVISNLLKSDGYDIHVSTAPEQPGELEVTEEHEYSVVLNWNQSGNFQDFVVKLNDTIVPLDYKFNENSSLVTCPILGEFSSGSYHVISVTSVSASGDESLPRIFEYIKDPIAPSQIKYLGANETTLCFSWRQQGHYDLVEVLGHSDHGKMKLKNWNYLTFMDGTIEGCIWGAHDSYHGFVIRLVRKHLKTSSPVFFFSAFRPPSNLRVTNVETDYAELWLDIETTEPNFPFQMLDFTVSSSVPGFERSQYVALTSFSVRTELTSLIPGTFYSVKVSGISPFYDDLPDSNPLFFVTIPESPRFFFKEILETSIRMDKVLPMNCDRIEMTISKYSLANPVKNWPKEISFPCNESSFQLNDLEPNFKYKTLTRTVSFLYNSASFNSNCNESFQTKSSAVSHQFWTKPEPVEDLKALNVNSSSFTLDWSFQKTQSFDTMPDYQTFRQTHIASNRNRRERYYSIQITVQNGSGFEIQKTKLSCLISTQDIHQIECPTSHSFIDLEPSTNYTVFVNIRNPGTHSKDKCISVLTGPPVVYVIFGDSLVIGILSTLSIIFLFVVVIILLHRFVQSKPRNMQPSSKRSSQVFGYQNPMFSVEMLENMQKPEDVKMADFGNYVKKLRKNSKQQITFQFMLLNQKTEEHPTTTAELPDNRVKNRYSNILPYEHSRVKLQRQGESDYINASFVPGYSSEGEYIATQAPLKDTINDFWQMVFQQNVSNIVMLTNLVENGKARCKQYWPHNDVVSKYGDIKIQIKDESHTNHYIRRTMQLSTSAEEQWRHLEHFQFLTWPDVEGADDIKTVVTFVRNFRQHLTGIQGDRKNPIVVHCSAGGARTGTFIMVDRLHQQLERQDGAGEINLFNVALELRNARSHMIQTEAQYMFVHECFLYMLKTVESSSATISEAASIARMSISSAPSECP